MNLSEQETTLRKVRSLNDIYESCKFAFFTYEPQNFKEAEKKKLEEMLWMENQQQLKKNQT